MKIGIITSFSLTRIIKKEDTKCFKTRAIVFARTMVKRCFLVKKGKVNGVKSIVYEKDGVVIAYKPIEDFLKDLMTDPYPEYTFSER